MNQTKLNWNGSLRYFPWLSMRLMFDFKFRSLTMNVWANKQLGKFNVNTHILAITIELSILGYVDIDNKIYMKKINFSSVKDLLWGLKMVMSRDVIRDLHGGMHFLWSLGVYEVGTSNEIFHSFNFSTAVPRDQIKLELELYMIHSTKLSEFQLFLILFLF